MLATLKALVTSVIVIAGSLSQAAYAADYELKLANFLPPKHPFTSQIVPEWSARIEEQSGGRIKITQYSSGQLLKVRETFDGVVNGVADIGFVMPGSTPGRFPILSIAELPFMYETAAAGSKAVMELYQSGALEKELAGVKVLYLHTHDLCSIHLRDKAVRVPSDLNGLRIRYPSVAVRDLLEAYGATPVGIPTPQIYENLEKGVVDGYGGGWNSQFALGTSELTKYHLDLPVYNLTFFLAMNQKVFDGMPADLQQVLLDNSGMKEAMRIGAIYDVDSANYRQRIVDEPDHVLVRPTVDELGLWKKGAEPAIDAYLKKLEADGMPAREYYDLLVKEAAAHGG